MFEFFEKFFCCFLGLLLEVAGIFMGVDKEAWIPKDFKII
jgi:hypothetical protein